MSNAGRLAEVVSDVPAKSARGSDYRSGRLLAKA